MLGIDKMSKSRSHEIELMNYLQDPKLAIAYLNAAIEDGDNEVFISALRNVAVARGQFMESENLQLHHFLLLIKDLDIGLVVK
jgi:DNA-binding phage protein